ncbi:MAG: NUDIX domain-containing protein, partial [Bacteriovoracaceae bacterium]
VRDHILLIKRSESMPSHSGQIAFVGGHKLAQETPWATAKREFEEETGLSSEKLMFIGLLDMVKTASQSLISPNLCYFDMDPQLFIKSVKSNGEWSEAILLPFESLQNLKLWTSAKSLRRGSENLILFYPIMRGCYISYSGDNEKDHLLWGATAKMIWNFFNFYTIGDL